MDKERAGLLVKLFFNLGLLTLCIITVSNAMIPDETARQETPYSPVRLSVTDAPRRIYFLKCRHFLVDESASINRIFDNWCPNHYILKSYGETVAIYLPDGREGLTLWRTLSVLRSELADTLAEEIAAGVAFDNLEAVESALEDAGS